MTTIDELLARAEITDVIQRLARGTDRLDRELMASCYHPDGYDDHNSFRGSGDEFAVWVCEVLPHFAATTHFIALPHIRLDGDTAPGSSPHNTLLALGKGDYRFHESSKPTATPDSKAPSVDSLTHELASRLSPKDFDAA